MTKMAVKSTIMLVVAITLSPSSARIIAQSALSSILHDILSPENGDQTIQLIKMAAESRANRKTIPEPARPLACYEQCPGRLASDFIPARAVVANDYLPARSVANEVQAINTGYARPVVTNSELPFQIFRQLPGRDARSNPIDPYGMPNDMFQSRYQALERAQPCPSLAAGYNPYLPAASPVSAILIPGSIPLPTQSRGQFLRKIPFPPPCI